MIQPASKNQYIQNVTNAKLDVSGTGSLETIYTAPGTTEFDFAVIESILVGDDNGQATTIDLVVTTGSSNHFLFKQKNISANGTVELLTRDLVLKSAQSLKIQVSHSNINVFVSLVEYGKGD